MLAFKDLFKGYILSVAIEPFAHFKMEPVLSYFAEQGLYWEREKPLWTGVL